jgi:glycogen debranching enzyme
MGWEVAANRCQDYTVSSRLEWILPNGLGGYASGTVSGANARRYHGLLVAATHPPAERMVLLANVEAFAVVRGQKIDLSTNHYVGAVHPEGYKLLSQFRVGEHAEWTYDAGGAHLRKRLKIHAGVNAATIEYANLGSQPVQLSLRPLVCHKFYHDNFRLDEAYPDELDFPIDETVLVHEKHRLVLRHVGMERHPLTGWFYRFENEREEERGLDPVDDLFCPCELKATLMPGERTVLVAALGDAPEPAEFEEFEVGVGVEEQLREAAAMFFVKGGGRSTIIAGYPWFSDWGRDTMIALPGLAEAAGRWDEAKGVLRSYAAAMRQGLIPNRFDDRGGEPDYNTVDATLWFAHATHQTLLHEWDSAFAHEALAWFEEVADWHIRGTWFGIKVDPSDGLLTQGEPGVQLTWMDAKVDDWVITPRHGKPVEVNGLWINFLRVLEWLCDQLGQDGLRHRLAAEKAESNFEPKFWRESVGHYLDTADPDDALLRPNQVIAMGLPYCPMTKENAVRALEKVRAELFTPLGLRTLGPRELGYAGRFEGSMSQRDAVYHQGTVWPWLLGSYVAACLQIANRRDWAEEAVGQIGAMLDDYGLGGIAEVYDGDAPHRPGACPWQAWSVAEVSRAFRLVQRSN